MNILRHILRSYWKKIKVLREKKALKNSHVKFLRFQFPDPCTRMSLALIERPWPVLLPDTIKSPSSNGSNEMISYSGMPVFRYGLRVLIELATHWVKFGSDLWQTWRNSAAKCNIYN